MFALRGQAVRAPDFNGKIQVIIIFLKYFK